MVTRLIAEWYPVLPTIFKVDSLSLIRTYVDLTSSSINKIKVQKTLVHKIFFTRENIVIFIKIMLFFFTNNQN